MTTTLAAPPKAKVAMPTTPYVGLTPFTERDAPFFFGREKERRIISANLLASRLTLLYGASGVGKSSIIRAGVQRDFRTKAEEALAEGSFPESIVVVFTGWRDDPVAGLKESIAATVKELLGPLAPRPPSKRLRLDDLLVEWIRRLDEKALKHAGPEADFDEPIRTELLIVFDQFEQYFVYHGDEDGPGTFAVQFPEAVNREELRASFLIALREDAYTQLDRFEGPILNLFSSNLRIDHLDEKAAAAAIVKPVERYNELLGNGDPEYRVEAGLVKAVIRDVRAGNIVIGQAGGGVVEHAEPERIRVETPFLQLVMSRLWAEEQRKHSHVLSLSTLTDLGGAEQIVRTHLDEAMSALNDDERAVAARMFHQLVTPSGARIVHSARDLAGYADVPVEIAEPILERLDERRILRTIDAAPGEKTPRFEIRHDVLAGAVVEWSRQYEEAQRRAADEERQREELAAQRKKQKTRMLQGGAISLAFLIPAALGGFYVWNARSDARAQRDRSFSTINAEHAFTQLFAADPNVSVGLAATAYFHAHAVPQAEDALRAALAISRRRGVLVDYPSGITAARFSRDGTMVATASRDGVTNIWSTATGKLLQTLPQPSGHPVQGLPSVNDLAFSPNGTLLATANSDRSARLWKVSSGRLVDVLGGHKDKVESVVFSKDGRLLLTAGLDWTPRIWRTGRPPGHAFDRILSGHTGSIYSASFSPDGRQAVTASGDGTARIWFLQPRRPSIILRTAAAVLTASFSPDGRKVVTGRSDGIWQIWDARSGRALAAVPGHTAPILRAEFSPNGRLVLTASADGTTRLWDANSGKSLGVLKPKRLKRGEPLPTVASASFSPDGAYVVTAQGNVARIWRTDGGNRIWTFRGHDDLVTAATISPDESRVLTAGEDGTARLFDTGLGRPATVLPTGGDAVSDVSIDPSSTSDLIVAGLGSAMQVWSLSPTKRLATLPIGRPVTSVAFSPDGKLVAATSTDGTTKVFGTTDWRPVTSVSAEGRANDVAFSPDGKLVVVGSDHGARVWRLKGRTEEDVPKVEDKRVTHVAFSQDGKHVLALTDAVNGVYVLDLGSRKIRQRPYTVIHDASFGPNGTVVAAADDGYALIWSKDGTLIRKMRRSLRPLVSVSRSRDGEFVVTAGKDGRVRVWESLSGRLILEVYDGPGLESAVLTPDNRFLITDAAGRLRVHPCEVCLPIEELVALGNWDIDAPKEIQGKAAG